MYSEQQFGNDDLDDSILLTKGSATVHWCSYCSNRWAKALKRYKVLQTLSDSTGSELVMSYTVAWIVHETVWLNFDNFSMDIQQ